MGTQNTTDHTGLEHFTIHFTFQEQTFEGAVTSALGQSHVQYTVWPEDIQLQNRFGAQVFHSIDGKELQTAFPDDGGLAKEYIAALKKGLTREINTKK